MSLQRRELGELLSQADFLRALAHGLLRDEHGAEDLVQDTWVAALEHAPEDARSLRAWLARVARNLAFNAGRGERRRKAREQAAARPELQASHEETVDRLELLRVVADLVLELREPYRSAVFLRYYQGLEPKAIAQRLRLPAETVKTQLARARAMLRAGLDARAGGRKTWTGGLLVLGLPRPALTAAAATPLAWIGASLAMKKPLLVVLALVLSVVAWRGLQDSAVPSETLARTSAPAPGPTSSLEAPAVLPPPVSESRQLVEATRDPGAGVPAPEPPAAAVLSGSVRVRDVRGAELAPIDGVLMLQVLEGKEPLAELEVEVRLGEWSLALSGHPTLTHVKALSVATAGTELVIESPRGPVRMPAAGPIEVKALVPNPVVLRVLDAATGLDLQEVQLVRYPNRFEVWPEHPGADFAERIERPRPSSPIALSDLMGSREPQPALIVGADGHGWKRVPIDWDFGGEHRVALGPGGDLELHVRGVEAGRATEVRLRIEGSRERIVAEAIDADGRVVLRALEPRIYRASLEVGDWDARPLVLAEAVVEVLAGEMASVSLDLQPAPPLELASASGRVLMPKLWGVEELILQLDPLDPGAAIGGGRWPRIEVRRAEPEEELDVFEWSATGMEAGAYELAVWSPRASMVLDLPPGETAGQILRVPPPADLTVRVVEARSGRSLKDVDLLWYPTPPPGRLGGLTSSAKYDPAADAFRFRAARGSIELRIFDLRYQAFEGRMDAGRGELELTVRLEPPCGIEVSLQDGNARVLLPRSWLGEVVAVEGTQGKFLLGGSKDRVLRIVVTAPGTYTLQPPKLDGYLQPPLQRVEVRPGEYTQHVVQLEREP